MGESRPKFILVHWGRDKMAAIFQTIFFKIDFLEWKVSYFDPHSTEVFFYNDPINNMQALVQIMAWRQNRGQAIF